MNNLQVLSISRDGEYLVEALRTGTEEDDREVLLHWFPDPRRTVKQDHHVAAFRSLSQAQKALFDLRNVFRKQTNSVAGLRATEQDLFCARRGFFHLQRVSGIMGTEAVCASALYPTLRESVAEVAQIKNVPVPSAPLRGTDLVPESPHRMVALLKLHIPLANGVVKRGFVIARQLPPFCEAPEATATDLLLDTLDKTLNYGFLVEDLVSPELLPKSKGTVLMGEQLLTIDIDRLPYVVQVHKPTGSLGLYDTPRCADMTSRTKTEPAKPLEEFCR